MSLNQTSLIFLRNASSKKGGKGKWRTGEEDEDDKKSTKALDETTEDDVGTSDMRARSKQIISREGESSEDESGDFVEESEPNLLVDPKRLSIVENVGTRITKKVMLGMKRKSNHNVAVGGDGQGLAGYAFTRASDSLAAREKAKAKLLKSLSYYERFDERTVFHEVRGKHIKTKLLIFPRKPGAGIKASGPLRACCRAVGLKDVTVKVHGSTCVQNQVIAFFTAMSKQSSVQDVALKLGKKVWTL